MSKNMRMGEIKISNEELIRLAKNGDGEAEREFFIVNDRFCHYVVKRWRNTSIHYDDLLSIARLGIFKAYRVFDPDKGFKFATFAFQVMENELRMNFRREKKHANVDSFSEISIRDKEGKQKTVEDFFGEEDSGFDDIEKADVLKTIIDEFSSTASEVELFTLKTRFFDNLTQYEVAKKAGMSQSYIGRIEKRVSEKLKKISIKHGVIDTHPQIKKEVKQVATKAKVNIPNFVYLVKNYPDLKQKDISIIFGIEPKTGLICRYFKSYTNGEFDAVNPEPDNMDELVAKHIRKYYPEFLSGPVKITKQEPIIIEQPKEVELILKEPYRTPADYMKMILNGDKVVVTDEQLKNQLVNAMECLGIISNTTVRSEWTISA